MKLLPEKSITDAKLTSPQIKILDDLGFIDENLPIANFHEIVGQALFNTLLTGKIQSSFISAIQRIRYPKKTIELQIRFYEGDVDLTTYPWELLFYRQHLLLSGAINISRYISFQQTNPFFDIPKPLKVLYIKSQPADLVKLSKGYEHDIVQNALQELIDKKSIEFTKLSRATYSEFCDQIKKDNYNILHFDGHGYFGRLCPNCNKMHYPKSGYCRNCGYSLVSVSPLGYLAFEDESKARKAQFISSKTLATIVYKSDLHMAILSACRSGEAKGEIYIQRCWASIYSSRYTCGCSNAITNYCGWSYPFHARVLRKDRKLQTHP